MSNILQIVCVYATIVPALVGIAKWRSISKVYRPLIIYCICSMIADLTCTLLNSLNISYFFVSNIFRLSEFLTLGLFFKNLNDLKGSGKFIGNVLVIGTLIWIVENFLLQRINETSIAVRLMFQGVIIFLSVDQINQVMEKERKNIFRNTDFIISSCVLVLFTYSIVYEVPYLLQLKMDVKFYKLLSYVFWSLNILVYALLTISLLWIPTRRKFTLPY